MAGKRLLLTGVFGPFGIKNKYAEGTGMQMELLNNQITRGQGAHSPRQSYWTFPLYLLAENISLPSTVLDFPSWNNFTRELKNGYTHVGINFIVANVYKAKRMAEYIRKHYPGTVIILGGYGTIIPDLKQIVPCDEICRGEGVRWLRSYFGEDPDRPIKHPAIFGPAYEYIYGIKSKPRGGILLPGVGCENGCPFCITSHQFNKKYLPLLKTGREIFDACVKSKLKIGAGGFSIMDENFLKSPDRARELLEEMTRHAVPFVFDIFSSAEVIRQVGVDFLVRLGVRMVWVGVESKANSHVKTKGIDLKELFDELQAKGIVVNASAMLFMEHHTEESLREDIDWVIGLGSDLIQFMNYTPLPRTALYERMKSEGILKNMDYRSFHGQGELAYEHPVFRDSREHYTLLKNAFRKKYRTGGPGIVNMAKTAVQGYRKAIDDFISRRDRGLCWDPATLRYEPSQHPQPDEFMLLRIKKMRKIAKALRPVLPAAFILSPNNSSRKKVMEVMKLYRKTLGPLSIPGTIASVVVAMSGLVEFARLQFARLLGHETLVKQPPVKRTVYPDNLMVLSRLTGEPAPLMPRHVSKDTCSA